jgi:hypothetical protein
MAAAGGVVAGVIELPVLGEYLLDQTCDVAGVGHVGRDDQRASAVGAQVGGKAP